MAVRNIYTSRDERLMWEHLFESLQVGDNAAYQPKGLTLWKKFEVTQKTNKTASSLATHFRKVMYDHIEDANLTVEQQLYIVNQLNIPLSKRQQRVMEYKANISIFTNDLGYVTSYKKEGKHYIPSLLKRKIPSGSILSAPEAPNIDRNYSAEACSGHYNLRKRTMFRNTSLRKDENSRTETESTIFAENSIIYESETGSGHVKNSLQEAVEAEQIILDSEEAEKSISERTSNDVNRRKFRELSCHKDKETKNEETSRSKNALLAVTKFNTNSINGVKRPNLENKHDHVTQDKTRQSSHEFPSDQLKQSEIESRISYCVQTVGSSKISNVSNECKSGLQKLEEDTRNNAACINMSSSVTSPVRKNMKLFVLDSIIEKEFKELFAYMVKKQQLKGVEKMKVEKMLDLRAKEAQELGISLRDYLKNLQLQDKNANI